MEGADMRYQPREGMSTGGEQPFQPSLCVRSSFLRDRKLRLNYRHQFSFSCVACVAEGIAILWLLTLVRLATNLQNARDVTGVQPVHLMSG